MLWGCPWGCAWCLGAPLCGDGCLAEVRALRWLGKLLLWGDLLHGGAVLLGGLCTSCALLQVLGRLEEPCYVHLTPCLTIPLPSVMLRDVSSCSEDSPFVSRRMVSALMVMEAPSKQSQRLLRGWVAWDGSVPPPGSREARSGHATYLNSHPLHFLLEQGRCQMPLMRIINEWQGGD